MKYFNKKNAERRYATRLRDREVWKMYDAIRAELGDIAPYVSKSYFYERLRIATGLSFRTLQSILNNFSA